jgi:2-hydroxychromene-2-carboxylate isomerase
MGSALSGRLTWRGESNAAIGALRHRSGSFGRYPPFLGLVGDLIMFGDRRPDRSRAAPGTGHGLRAAPGTGPAFFFDPSCPFSYLATERVERLLGEVEWVPTAAASLRLGDPFRHVPQHQADDDPVQRTRLVMARAEERALALKLPLVWPERFPAGSPAALRAAAYASHAGAGVRFALAASRLAFCGGFDLEDRGVLAEAAAAAGLSVDRCLAAARDSRLDGPIRATALGLAVRGVEALPALSIERHLLWGERMLNEAPPLLRVTAAVN